MKVKGFIKVSKNNFPFYCISDEGCLTKNIVLKRFGNREIREIDFTVDMQNERLANSDRLFKPTLSIVPKIYIKDMED
ncbi:hypothetical protein KQI18_11560 [Clostridioides mangenotii]|uniref:hypothetical protein n=1 Tax=Metaclostridioides mangenotii TaxID=1540 RepID=UPI001C0FF458|nr:hypothetical protein [Clostridioides mangenotii]MBU5308413.1 hypothetical protein [Clostridioides mangenotii]